MTRHIRERENMLYDVAFFIFSIFYLPVLLFKGKLHGEFRERFGWYVNAKRDELLSGSKNVWIQAVSVGEVSLCKSLVPILRHKYPDHKIVISTITKAGNELAKKLFGRDAVVLYFPLDFSFTVKRAVSVIRPKIYIMIETEIWPNVLKAVSENGIPSILLNGRISDRSYGKYIFAKPFLKATLRRISVFCMQSKADAERIISLGAEEARVRVTGNMKFDADIKPDENTIACIRSLVGLSPSDDLIVAGSTHNGEEEAVIRVYKKLVKYFPRLKLLIAPRHVERSGEVVRAALDAGFSPIRISDLKKHGIPVLNSQLFILDEIGVLNAVYALATVVFMGGSLISHGGQNPIEPAVLGRPILFGPYMFNFKSISAAFLDNNAALQISGEGELLEKVEHLLKDAQSRDVLGTNAKKVVMDNKGATRRNIDAVSGYI